jgi:tetratricopeptide (TPR) repeat protein
LSALTEISWPPHLIAIPLIPLALFLFNLPVISPHFKTQPDYSFAIVLTTVPLQYFIGFSLLRLHDRPIRSIIPLSLGGVLLCVLLISLLHIPRTISEYRALLTIPPTQKGAAELIQSWEVLLERNRVASIASIRGTAHERIGDLKLSLGDFDGAQQSYQRVLRDDPEDITAQIGLARLLLKQKGEMWKAMKVFQGVIEQNPSLAWVETRNFFPPLQLREMIIWGKAWDDAGKQKEALTVYGQALRMRPKHPWLNFLIGKIYRAQGDYEEAIAAFKQTLVKRPLHLNALSYLVDIYEEEGKMDLAQHYRDIILKKVVTHRIRLSDWQGTNGENLCTKGGCHARVTLYRGKIRLTIHARGTPAQGIWPHMVVKLNKETIGEVDVNAREFMTYAFTTDVETGDYTLWVYFTNDFYLVKETDGAKGKEDRNLFVDAAEIIFVQ